MNQQTFELLYADAVKAVKEHRLLDAIRSAEGMAGYVAVPALHTALAETREAYKMLLHYMGQGVEDPERDRLFGQFLRDTAECVEGLWREIRLRETDEAVSVAWRVLCKTQATEWQATARQLEMNAQAELLERSEPDTPHRTGELKRIAEEHRLLYTRLFDSVWASGHWRTEDKALAASFIASPTVREFDKCLFLSAAGLGALTFFDEGKIAFLLSASMEKRVTLRVRAQVGGVMAYLKFADRCGLYPELAAQIRLLADDAAYRTALLELQMQLLLSLETKKIEKNLREDIFPAVMRNARKFSLDKPFDLEGTVSKAMAEEQNPEWSQEGEKSSLEKKMRHLAEMQQSGADVFMASFRMLKQKFPFFSKAANWFCPFTVSHPELPAISVPQDIVRLFLGAGHLCHSDKYSFYLMLAELPANQLRAMQGQLAAALQGSGLDAASVETGTPESAAVERRLYLQDLYRYFQLFAVRGPEPDPFKMNLMLADYPPFSEALSDANSLCQLGNFTFKEGNYGQALAFYERIPAEEVTADIWQKMGYCRQLAGNYEAALAAFERADLLKPGSAWTLGKMAVCYRRLSKFSEALRCYEELERMQPENIKNLLLLGESYVCAGRHEDAFEKFFKADYLAPDSQETKRALAWYSLVAGKPEQAERYYAKLLSGQPSADDWLNAGHAAWVQGMLPEAVERYRAALRKEGKDFAADDFLTADATLLEKYGKRGDALRQMTDLLNQ